MSVQITGFTQTILNPFQDVSGSSYYAGLSGSGATYYNTGNLYVFQEVGSNNTATGSITIPNNYSATINYYLVGGGGGGAQYGNASGNGGGGGGGTNVSNQITTSGPTTLTISIGAGGGGANNIVPATAGGTTTLIYLGNTINISGGFAGTSSSPVTSVGSNFIDSLGNIYYYGSGGGFNVSNSSFISGTGGNGCGYLGGSGAAGNPGGGGGGGGGTSSVGANGIAGPGGSGGGAGGNPNGGTGGFFNGVSDVPAGNGGFGGGGGGSVGGGGGGNGGTGGIGGGGGGGGGSSGSSSNGGNGGVGGGGGGGGGVGNNGGNGGINGGGGGSGHGGIGGNGGIGLIVLEIILRPTPPTPEPIPELPRQSYYYNPIPPRVWSRVQAPCTYTDTGSNYETAYIPLTNQTVPLAQAIALDQNLYKGNILQYKGNSSRITKKQKYAQISKGMWCNRTKVFATQSTTYTNPNTTAMQRVNYTTLPYPNQIVGQPNNISGPFQYNVPSPYECPTTSVQEGGNLVCGTYVNPCNGQVIQKIPQPPLICNSSTASDVPGIPVDLCWTPKVQTWFPRNNLTNSNSLDKWPEGYKGLVSAVTPDAPVLSLESTTVSSATLSWIYDFNKCIPISSFRIYQDGILVKTVPYQITSTTLYGLKDCNTYSFYATAVSNTTPSDPSNTVEVYLVYPLPPTITSGILVNETITINWTPNLNCAPINNYLIYQNGTLIATVASDKFVYEVNDITDCGVYSFYIISYNQIDNNYSEQSNVLISNVIPLAPTDLSGNAISLTGITITWKQPFCCNTVNGGYIYYSTSQSGPFTKTPLIPYDNNPNTSHSYTLSSLQNNATYYFYMITKSNNANSVPSATISVATPALNPPTITGASASSLTSINVSWSWSPPPQYPWETVTDWYIYYSTSPSGTFVYQQFSNSPNISSATLTGLSNNTSYYIYIVGYNSTYNVYSVNSNTTGPILIPKLASPTITNAIASFFTSITVTWSWSLPPQYPWETVTDWIIYYSTSPSGPFVYQQFSNSLPISSATLINLTINTSYYIYMVAYNGSLHSDNSNTTSAILIPPLQPPSNVSGTSSSFTSITVTWSWSPPPQYPWETVTGYNVYYSTGSTPPTSPQYIVSSSPKVISGLTDGTSYYIWVQAYYGSITSSLTPISPNPFTLQYNGYWYLSNGVLTSGYPISAPQIYVLTDYTPDTVSSQPSAAWNLTNGALISTLPIFVNSVNAVTSGPQTSYVNYWYYANNGTAIYTTYPISINYFFP